MQHGSDLDRLAPRIKRFLCAAQKILPRTPGAKRLDSLGLGWFSAWRWAVRLGGGARPVRLGGVGMGYRLVPGVLLAALVLVAGAAPASAEIENSARYAGIVVDARTGRVLVDHHADETRHPASLTKMMTLYLLFDALRDGRVRLDTPIRFSEEAASRPPSKLGVPAGRVISAETAILALVTRSANDVAAAVAEHLAGNEDAFARVMTQRARQMGMTRTTFRNASGLPDPEQVTTARDMALLGRRLIQDFPDRYTYFSATHFRHGAQLIRNHNGMLTDYAGTDGIKTGYIRASGFNIVTSAERENVRLVGAVFGGRSWVERNRQMAELLDDGFQRMGVRGPGVAAAGPRVMEAREAAGGGYRPPVRLASAPPRPAARPAVQTAARGNAPVRPIPVVARQPAPRPGAVTAQGSAGARPAAAQAPRSTTARPAATPPRPPAARQPAPRPRTN
jgi:D-alanyl-D-alanine carboxypeptidase